MAALGLVEREQCQAALRRALAEHPDDLALVAVDLAGGPVVALVIREGDTELVLLRSAGAEGTLVDFVGAVPFAYSILEHFLTDPYQAITVVDDTATVRFISPVHERFLGLSAGAGIGKSAEEAIPNSRLREVLTSGKAEIGKPQAFGKVTRVVNRRPILREGRIVGAIGQVMFKEPEAVSRMHGELSRLRSEVETYRRELDSLRDIGNSLAELIGHSEAIRRLKREITAVAKLDVPVLILGESGTGKELVARAIHALSRPKGSLVSLNLAALPASLLESELFGYASGAFTGGARQGRPGKLELAGDGTLFLDEVGDIPAEIQTKLLRVLEDRVVERLGSHESKQVSFRLVSATHRGVEEMIESGAFRQDLFYRINGVTLRVPPLRERREDIPALLANFVRSFCQRNGFDVPTIDPDVPRYLAAKPWPGNVRQLRHRVEEALVFSDPGRLTVAGFERDLGDAAARTSQVEQDSRNIEGTGSGVDGAVKLKDLERVAAFQTVAECGGNKKRAAELLGISRSYLYKLLGSR